jgi:glycosyltransferase involved in cell wall biosynthesis
MIPIVHLLKKENPDIMILNFSANIKTVGVAAKFAGIRSIVYRRGSAIPIRNTLVNRFLYRKIITHLIANSKETKRSILHNNKNLIPADKIKVIYNGINLKQFDNIPGVNLYPRRENEILIGNASRLIPQKGQKYLVEMAEILKKKNLDFKILIAGDGPLESSLKLMARQAGIENQIVFLGFIDNIKAFMENIDVFVLTSLGEGFGYVLIEAMACKKPVVAFNNSSIPEIVIPDETGFLINNQDMATFTQKVESLINDPTIRESFGIAGRRRVEEVFDVAKTEKELEHFLVRLKSSPGNGKMFPW